MPQIILKQRTAHLAHSSNPPFLKGGGGEVNFDYLPEGEEI